MAFFLGGIEEGGDVAFGDDEAVALGYRVAVVYPHGVRVLGADAGGHFCLQAAEGAGVCSRCFSAGLAHAMSLYYCLHFRAQVPWAMET